MIDPTYLITLTAQTPVDTTARGAATVYEDGYGPQAATRVAATDYYGPSPRYDITDSETPYYKIHGATRTIYAPAANIATITNLNTTHPDSEPMQESNTHHDQATHSGETQ